MTDIKVYTDNEKLQEAYEKIAKNIDSVSEEYQLTFFELFGILKACETDIVKLDINGSIEE